MIDSLKRKLDPRRFPGMTPFMMAMLGYVLGEQYTKPEIEELVVSEGDNLVFIRTAGAVKFNDRKPLDDVRSNWNRLMDAAALTPEERAVAVRLFKAKVEMVPETEV